MKLSAFEFIQRFLYHIPPKRYFRIRYYGKIQKLSTINNKLIVHKTQDEIQKTDKQSKPLPQEYFLTYVHGECKTLNKINIKFDNNRTVSEFSEGQKKEILITFITEVLASQNSLFLLDEPDSHIHPIKKLNLINILKNSDTKNIIMTTHSPTLIREIETKHLVLIQEGKAKDTNKIDLLKEITDGKWAIDSINNILIANKDIILVEGKTDIEYIETALQRLREYPTCINKYQNLDFTFIPTGGASGLINFIDKFTVSGNQKVIALLDRDVAGKASYSTIFDKKTKSLVQSDIEDIHDKNGIKIIFLPTNNNWENNFEIEDYFGINKLKSFGTELYRDAEINQLKDFMNIKDLIKQNLPIKCKDNSKFKKEDFKNFKKLFDLILRIKG